MVEKKEERRKSIVIGEFILRKVRDAHEECMSCDKGIREEEFAFCDRGGGLLHPACIFPYLDGRIKELKFSFEDKDKLLNQKEEIERRIKNLPLQEKKLTLDIKELEQIKEVVLKTLEEIDLLEEVIVKKL